MSSVWKRALIAAVIVPLALVALGVALGVARAQTTRTYTMQPTGSQNAGLAGTVTVTQTGANQVRVDVRVTGLPANSGHADHIHSPGTQSGSCDTGGPVVYPLNDVQADGSGTGTSSTTVTFDPAKGIPTSGWYFNVHQNSTAGGTGAGIICAPINGPLVSGAAATPAAGGAASSLPPTGTGGAATVNNRPLVLLLVIGALALAGTGVTLVRRRL